MVQCGSFRGARNRQRRYVLSWRSSHRDLKITTNNGWNRVVIGPVKGKENADSTLNRSKMAVITNPHLARRLGSKNSKSPTTTITSRPVLLYGGLYSCLK
ncbi:SPOR domain-containing protein [Escherichia coli]